MASERFREFCIVGLGKHALTKLIPAIRANGQAVVATVDSKVQTVVPGATAYSSVLDATDALPSHTAFLVATPPAAHFEVARTVAARGFDLLVEKPAFLSRADAQAIAGMCQNRGAVLVECHMQRHTGLYGRLVQYWADNRDQIVSILIRFVIPGMPPGTFRSEVVLASASIFDIGCYPVSLLMDLGLEGVALRIVDVRFAGQPDKELLRLEGRNESIGVAAEIGVSPTYANVVEFALCDGRTVAFSPLFYGRAGARRITISSPGKTETDEFEDRNAYEVMFAVPCEAWLLDQANRSRQIIERAAILEGLALELSSIRAAKSTGIVLDGSIE